MKKGIIAALILVLIFVTHFIVRPPEITEHVQSIDIDWPSFVLNGIPFDLTVKINQTEDIVSEQNDDWIALKMDGLQRDVQIHDGIGGFKNLAIGSAGTEKITLRYHDKIITHNIRVVPAFLSLLPPILAIILALTARRVLLALFSGIFLGATLINGYDPLQGLLHALDTYLINALTDPDHVAIVMFSMTLGGMVGVISRSGGTSGIVEKVTKYANHRRGGLLTSWGLGILVFFDDYANTLIVGNTMRPFTDKLKIAREKLAYIVDSTAAPVASLFPVSTWVGFQIALIAGVFASLGIKQDAYLFFIESIPYASYSLLCLVFVGLLGITLRDFGPMLKAEKRAVIEGKVLSDTAVPLIDSSGLDMEVPAHIPRRWYNALIPIMTVITVTLVGLYYSGVVELGPQLTSASFRDIISHANSFDVLMWAAFSGAFMSILLAWAQDILTLSEGIEAWLGGAKSMVLAMIILTMAWAIGQVCTDLMTANYVIELTRSFLSPHYMPVVTFIIAALIGFATGTSWATMAILIPIVIPIAHELCQLAGLDAAISQSILLGTVGAVLSGSVFGDHSSPISDTTIMSSMSSAVDHVDHVKTQLPYALVVAGVAILTGYLPAGFGWNIYASTSIGVVLLVAILFFVGKRADR